MVWFRRSIDSFPCQNFHSLIAPRCDEAIQQLILRANGGDGCDQITLSAAFSTTKIYLPHTQVFFRTLQVNDNSRWVGNKSIRICDIDEIRRDIDVMNVAEGLWLSMRD